MKTKEAIFHLERIKTAFEKSHMDTEAEALALAIDMLTEHEQHRRSWEEILEEEKIDG